MDISKRSKIVIALALIGMGVGAFFFYKKDEEKKNAPKTK